MWGSRVTRTKQAWGTHEGRSDTAPAQADGTGRWTLKAGVGSFPAGRRSHTGAGRRLSCTRTPRGRHDQKLCVDAPALSPVSLLPQLIFAVTKLQSIALF